MLDAASIYVMADEFVHQLAALDAQTGMSDEERADARRRLVLTSMITGALLIVCGDPQQINSVLGAGV